jgi:hypothetical protein
VHLVAWLTDALDEDERVAKAAQPGPWSAFRHHATGGSVGSADARGVADRRNYDDYARYETGEWLDHGDAVHIARWDPARVLAEVAAKRAILEQYRVALRQKDWPACTVLEDVLPVLAQPYRDRPGFDLSWLAE